jgi:hypothetical protein
MMISQKSRKQKKKFRFNFFGWSFFFYFALKNNLPFSRPNCSTLDDCVVVVVCDYEDVALDFVAVAPLLI